ncbi:MAG: hypothetical protein KAV00_00385 [Phycisphaerae bacterium]|nr:hypothetical protein [Phycisphaerae bacterium]
MSTGRKKSDTSSGQDKTNRPEPVDVIDGVPDRSGDPRPWKYIAVAAVFLAWISFLIICGIIGAL